jgi:hypothetical protein
MDEICYNPGGMRYECRSFCKILEENKPLDWCWHKLKDNVQDGS